MVAMGDNDRDLYNKLTFANTHGSNFDSSSFNTVLIEESLYGSSALLGW